MGVGLNNILHRSSIAARNMSNSVDLMPKLNASSTKITTGLKYTDLAQMDADGVRRTVDAARGELITISNYNTTIIVTGPKLEAQKKALEDINSVLVEFNHRVQSSGPLTKKEIADNALTKLQDILNRRDDGEYIFGGKNPMQSPMIEDIVNVSNKVGGQITSRYTNADEDMTLIDITDETSVRSNRLHAGFSGIQEMIEMLHFYKDPATPAATLASETESKYSSVTQSMSRLSLMINTDIAKINGSEDVKGAKLILSSARAVAQSKISEITAVDLTSESSNFRALLLSMLTSLSISQSRNDLLSRFSQIIS